MCPSYVHSKLDQLYSYLQTWQFLPCEPPWYPSNETNHLWLFNFLLFRLCFMWTMVPADSLLSTMPGSQGICAMDSGIKSRPIRSNTALSWQWMGTRWKPRAQTQHQHQLTQMTLCLLEVSQVSIVYPRNNFFSLLHSRFIFLYIYPRMWA